jgi:hypothetical protein
MLALVSLTLGALLMVSVQPQIVYVPVDTGVSDSQVPQSPMLAAGGEAAVNHAQTAASFTPQDRTEDAAARLVNGMSYLRARQLALLSPWDTGTGPSQASQQQAAIPPLCSGDWRTMVGDESSRVQPEQSPSTLPSDWKQLLNIRGS